MAAPTKYYVDQTSGNDSTGDGTSGTPWKTIEYALETGITTADTTNGDLLWVKGGGEAATKTWALNTWQGTGHRTAGPLMIRGCTAFDTYDEGRCAVSFGSNYQITNTYGTMWVNIDFTSSSSASGYLLNGTLSIDSAAINCQFSKTSDVTHGWIQFSTDATVINCRFSDLGTATAVVVGTNGMVWRSVFIEQDSYTRRTTNTVDVRGAVALENVFKMSSSAHTCAILSGLDSKIINNSIYAHGSATGKGIRSLGPAAVIANNLIEGYSGTNGMGIEMTTSDNFQVLAGNSTDDCNDGIDRASGSFALVDQDNDEGTTGSPFADPNAGDFTPQDVDSVKEGSWPGGVGVDY